MKTIVYVFGTRPELIKMVPLILESKKNTQIKTIVCSTGQHRDMLQSLYSFFDLKPDIDFQLMKPNQSLVALHSETMMRMMGVIEEHKPDWVVVQGDTTSAHAAAMAAFYMKVKVAHVEAGLRTYDIHSPFPEEMNRRAVGLVAKAHFAPTEEAQKHLLQEKIDASSYVEITGNTCIDALQLVAEKIDSNSSLAENFRQSFSYLNLDHFVLTTLHRRENFGAPQEQVLKALQTVASTHKLDILFPVHPNPNVRQAVEKTLSPQTNDQAVWVRPGEVVEKKSPGRIFLIEPLDYPALIFAMKNSRFIMTDSGGIQEEAPTFKKDILVLRQSTERPEGVKAGFSTLVGTDYERVVSATEQLIKGGSRAVQLGQNPYGDGKASFRILNSMLKNS